MHVKSNVAESMNAVLNNARSKPILDYLDFIWNWIYKTFYQRLIKASSNNSILTEYSKKLQAENKIAGAKMYTNSYSPNHGRVISSGKIYEVHLNERNRNCKLFSDLQFPCKHAFVCFTSSS